MKKIRIFWIIFPATLLIIIAGLLLMIRFSTHSLWDFYLKQTSGYLEAQGHLIIRQYRDFGIRQDTGDLQRLCVSLSAVSSSRLTIIDAQGIVLCDSEKEPHTMDNHGDRLEIMQAFTGSPGQSIRYSHTLKSDLMYVALPVREEEKITRVVRVSLPVASLKTALRSTRNEVITVGLLVASLAALLTWLVSLKISRPLERMRGGAEKMSQGDFSFRLPTDGALETSTLAVSMNEMAMELHNKLRTIQQQQSELDAVFSSMEEGVIAVDKHNRVVTLNPAASRLLQIPSGEVRGKDLLEIARHTALYSCVSSIASGSDFPGETLHFTSGERERYIQVHGSALKGEGEETIGALIVFNDITRMKKLENIRRDFAVNVSHELKTPIASIQGAVETLEDGAIANAADADRFLKMISKNSDRLHRIIEDLMSLSRIEREKERQTLRIVPFPVRDMLVEAVQACELKASEKQISIELDLPRDMAIPMDHQLLEQAIINLLDNAIQYSEAGSKVTVRTLEAPEEYIIEIEDRGMGIPEVHLSRIFERFYRVDRARSRSLGGTGLGLAIVKHISQVHGGYAAVKSIQNKGSVFSIHIPV